MFCESSYFDCMLKILHSVHFFIKFGVNWHIMTWLWILSHNIDIVRLLPIFFHDEIMLLDIYFEFFFWVLLFWPFDAYFVLVLNFVFVFIFLTLLYISLTLTMNCIHVLCDSWYFFRFLSFHLSCTYTMHIRIQYHNYLLYIIIDLTSFSLMQAHCKLCMLSMYVHYLLSI